MNLDGWVSVHRIIKKNWIWKDKPFAKGQAFVDMLLECNFQDHKVNIKNKLILCKRGESLNSLETWGGRWGWHKSKVRRFINLLIDDGMLERIPTLKTTHLSIVNFATYQLPRHEDDTKTTRRRHEDDTNLTGNNKDNNTNKGNKKTKGVKFFDDSKFELPLYFGDDIKDYFYDYIQMRKKIKKPMIDSTIQRNITRLTNLSNGYKETAVDILIYSTDGCYQGIFARNSGNVKSIEVTKEEEVNYLSNDLFKDKT